MFSTFCTHVVLPSGRVDSVQAFQYIASELPYELRIDGSL